MDVITNDTDKNDSIPLIVVIISIKVEDDNKFLKLDNHKDVVVKVMVVVVVVMQIHVMMVASNIAGQHINWIIFGRPIDTFLD
eukprot:10996653-Ditylum_brightwellii.AAC.1